MRGKGERVTKEGERVRTERGTMKEEAMRKGREGECDGGVDDEGKTGENEGEEGR